MDDFKLLVIQTGGTIDKDYPKRKGGYAFEICESGAMSVLSKVGPSFSFRLLTACLQDSQDLTDRHRAVIVNYCREAEEKFILITHGTDTILQTAAYVAKHLYGLNASFPDQSQQSADNNSQSTGGPQLVSNQSQSLPVKTEGLMVATISSPAEAGDQTNAALSSQVSNVTNKVIILTGAFLPERFKETDADFNVGLSVGAMQCGLTPGVYVSLSGRLLPWNKVTRSENGQFVSV